MQNGGLDEAQAGIRTAGRNINNLKNADDITLMAESEEELKNLLMKVKEDSEKTWNPTLKNNDHDIWSHHFMAHRRGEMEAVTDFICHEVMGPDTMILVL